jgi:hypothetical protein
MPGYVYFADLDGGRGLKVGHSWCPRERVRGFLRSQKPGEPGFCSAAVVGQVPGTTTDEARVHRWFAADRIRRVRSRECYRKTPAIAAAVAAILAAGSVPDTCPAEVACG